MHCTDPQAFTEADVILATFNNDLQVLIGFAAQSGANCR
jgi:hypothetical protein